MMALKATIFKAELQVSHLDRHYYQTHALTIARHPSETDERMMVRLLAFALYASSSLAFGRGLSAEDEADLLDADATGQILRWVDVGLPDLRAVRRACGRAAQVAVLAYGGRGADIWWQQNAAALNTLEKLTVLALSAEASAGLSRLAGRAMRLQCTVQEGRVWLCDGAADLEIELQALKEAAR